MSARERVLKNPRGIPTIVLYEFRLKKPIFESFKNMGKKLGPDTMIYPDFEFWWMRFEHGEFDLDYDRSQDPMYRTITDLPDNVLRMIYESGYVGMCFHLRHVCQFFRNSVDKWAPNIEWKPVAEKMRLTRASRVLRNRPEMSAREKVLRNPRGIPTIVLYEFRLKQPIFESFKNMGFKLGRDTMIYPDFEFWWMRFEQGKFDLDYDRSQDPKYRTITDLPDKVLQKIYESGDVGMCFTLRQVCRFFRNSVDKRTPIIKWKPVIPTIEISSSPDNVRLTLGSRNIVYKNMKRNRFLVVHSIGKEEDRVYEYYQDGNYMDVATDDLYSILKHPKLKLEQFSLSGKEYESKLGRRLIRQFESLKHKIHAVAVKLPYSVSSLLQYFKPGILKHIQIEVDREITVISPEDFKVFINGINELKQCQKANWIHFEHRLMELDTNLTISKNIKLPFVWMKYANLDVEKAFGILKILLQSSTKMKMCFLMSNTLSSIKAEILKRLLNLGAETAPYSSPDKIVLIYRIPGSNFGKCFSISISDKDIHIHCM